MLLCCYETGSLRQLVAISPLGTRWRTREACIGLVVADEALGLWVELKIDIEIFGDGSDVQNLGEQAGDTEGRFGPAFAHAGVDEAIEVIALQWMQPHRVFEFHHLRSWIQEGVTIMRAALHEVVALLAMQE